MISRRKPILHIVPENQIRVRSFRSLYQRLNHIWFYPIIPINMHYPFALCLLHPDISCTGHAPVFLMYYFNPRIDCSIFIAKNSTIILAAIINKDKFK